MEKKKKIVYHFHVSSFSYTERIAMGGGGVVRFTNTCRFSFPPYSYPERRGVSFKTFSSDPSATRRRVGSNRRVFLAVDRDNLDISVVGSNPGTDERNLKF